MERASLAGLDRTQLKSALAAAGVELVRRRSGGGAVYLAPGEQLWIDAWVPRDDALWEVDVAVAAVLTRILGWHWAFLPTLAAELIPGVDLIPTWTAAVYFVTRQQVRSGEPEILPPESAPYARS